SHQAYGRSAAGGKDCPRKTPPIEDSMCTARFSDMTSWHKIGIASCIGREFVSPNDATDFRTRIYTNAILHRPARITFGNALFSRAFLTFGRSALAVFSTHSTNSVHAFLR